MLRDAARAIPTHRRDEFLDRVNCSLAGEVSDVALDHVIGRVLAAMRASAA
jgi:hypothetical protein